MIADLTLLLRTTAIILWAKTRFYSLGLNIKIQMILISHIRSPFCEGLTPQISNFHSMYLLLQSMLAGIYGELQPKPTARLPLSLAQTNHRLQITWMWSNDSQFWGSAVWPPQVFWLSRNKRRVLEFWTAPLGHSDMAPCSFNTTRSAHQSLFRPAHFIHLYYTVC